MSRPTPGTYIITNKARSTEGNELTITFNGKGNALTVDNRTDSPSQRWKISNYSDGRTSYVVPVSAPSLQVAWGRGVAIVLPAGAYVWTIRETRTGYTIQDGGLTAFWGVAHTVDGAKVTIGGGTGEVTQRWHLKRVA
ncbi:hypothetical protein BS47DRAFT_1299653 [Hydnum rufescens UP504]|uniref:CCL2-like lectin domain-containing protein n=1 Tax=Hydnum rufescens UP504 TaxID=1448309 RepID=A0A9P6DUP6_9AGAM|nr:hypothetical protein BS47DRAFT_1299653 [Hydnum rufescens UP504]